MKSALSPDLPTFDCQKARSFYYVIKYKHAAQAAEALLTSPEDMLRDISLLEEEMACDLFLHRQGNCFLTYDGEQLFNVLDKAYKEKSSLQNRNT